MFVQGHVTFVKMEKKIDRYSKYEGFSIKNLQQSIVFWRFLASKNYFASSLTKNYQLSKKNDEEKLKNVDLPNTYLIEDETCNPFEVITNNLLDSDTFLPKLFLVDNSEIASRIKKTLLSVGYYRKGVLPSVNLLSDFETYQANRPIDQDSEILTSYSKRLIDLVEKVPILDDKFSKKPASSFEIASDWLKVINRWEWLEESWKILGAPHITHKDNDFELGSLEFLFLLKNAMHDKSNPAIWHSRQYNLALSDQSQKTQYVNTHSSVVMVLTELPDPLVFAKALILARLKISSWKIFLVNHPLAFDAKKGNKNGEPLKSWEKNFPLIWPEAFKLKTSIDSKQDNNDFVKRREETFNNCKSIFNGYEKKSQSLPLRCIEVKSLDSMTEILVLEIKRLLKNKTSKIGIVASDRRAARRLIAKLNQFKIEIDDSAGWCLNTSVVSLSIINLIKIISRKISVEDFYYWLKIPLVFRALISNNFITSEGYEELTLKVKNCKEVNEVFKILPIKLNQVLTGNNLETLEKNLITILEKSGVENELLTDPAGQVALKVCRKLEVDLTSKNVGHEHFINLIEWEFSNNNFSLKSSNTTIKLISFQQALWNPPDSILVIGATSQYMPNVVIPKFVESALWERAVAHLSKKQVELFRLKTFISILKLQIPIILVGQLQTAKGSVSWSRWVERIRLMIPCELEKKIFSKFAVSYKVNNPRNLSISHPNVFLNDYPDSISVSDIKNLIECPYKFFWIKFFGLSKTDYLGDNTEYRETGIGLHLLMERIGNDSANSPDYLKNKYTQKDWFNFFISNINQMRNQKLISWETALNLRARIIHFSKWCESFFYLSSPLMIEEKLSARLPELPVLVKGKIDRVEQKNDEMKTTTLIDFKSSKVVGLKNELQSAQILVYTWLLGLNQIYISEAGYLCVTNKETKWLKLEDLLIQKELIKKISQVLSLLIKGHPVKPIAAKSGHLCKNCSVRNACRKNEWVSNKSIW